MKREWIMILTVSILLTALMMPFASGLSSAAGTVPTTTAPLVTTTTTWVLTGPDGTNTTTQPLTTTTTVCGCISTPPPVTTTGNSTTLPTTVKPSACGDVNDVLSNATVEVSDTVALLGHPQGGHWLSADCYSYDGGTITLIPNGAALNDGYDYMHLTVTANVPFTVVAETSGCLINPMTWFPEDAQQDDGFIAKGAYVLSGDIRTAWEDPNPIRRIVVTLAAPGSVTVGHIALSNDPVCREDAPKIQTTTRPSFPWDSTTTTDDPLPTTTTNPTMNDALLPGDADGDGVLTTSDARVILTYCLGIGSLGENGKLLADCNGDGYVTTLDTRMILMSLVGNP